MKQRPSLEAARKMPYMAPSLVLEAIRKARTAIYYSLGEPAFIEVLLREEGAKTQAAQMIQFCDFSLKLKAWFSSWLSLEEVNGEAMMKQADTLVQIAEDIVATFTEEKVAGF